MTMAHERTRALRWGHEVLREIRDGAALADKDRARAGELLRTYLSPSAVSEWIKEDVTSIPTVAAAAIEETGTLMRSILMSKVCTEPLRRSLTFTLRHSPEPGTAGPWAKSSAAWTITTWLLPENQYDRR